MTQAGGRELRVATYNLYLGADLTVVFGKGRTGDPDADLEEVLAQLTVTAFERRAGALARVIAAEDLDLVGLQEACTWSVDGVVVTDFADLLVRALAKEGCPCEVVVEQATFRGASKLPSGDQAGAEVELVGSNLILRRQASTTRVLSTDSGLFEAAHSTTIVDRNDVAILRGWCSALVETSSGQRVLFATTHTEAYFATARDEQRDQLLALLPPEPAALVLVGDFNATPDEVGMPVGLVDAWVAAGHATDAPEGATCGQAPMLDNEESQLADRIDYVWVRGVEVRGCRRIGAAQSDRSATGLWPSDHAGVAADLYLPG